MEITTTPSPVRLQIASQKVFRLFREYSHLPFVFVNHAGNFGDSLIFMGAEKLARLAELNYKNFSHEEFMTAEIPAGQVIYIQGGGGFNAFWCGDVMEELAKAITIKDAIVIVGPQTFVIEKDFLAENVLNRIQNHRAAKLHIFTRGPISYQGLKEVLPDWTTLDLDHDTALNLTLEDFTPLVLTNRYRYYAIRDDKEKTPLHKQSLFWVWNDPVFTAANFQQWLALHANASEIITNRLHSSIAGVILQKSVTLLPNSYFKNKAVWEFSLKDRGVKWADNLEEGKAYQIFKRIKLYNKFLNSYKVNKIVQEWMTGMKI